MSLISTLLPDLLIGFQPAVVKPLKEGWGVTGGTIARTFMASERNPFHQDFLITFLASSH